MKKSIFVLVALFLGLTSMAQEHLSFKGISIEGSMESFCEKLADKGFTELRNDGNTTLFTGDFLAAMPRLALFLMMTEKMFIPWWCSSNHLGSGICW